MSNASNAPATLERPLTKRQPRPKMTDAEMIESVRLMKDGSWQVRSWSHPEITYRVRRGEGADGLRCTCPARRWCWHLDAVELFHAHMLADFDPFDLGDVPDDAEEWAAKSAALATDDELEREKWRETDERVSRQPRLTAPMVRFVPAADHYKLLSDFADEFSRPSVFSL